MYYSLFKKNFKIFSKKKYLTFYIHVEETDLKIFRPKSVFYLKKGLGRFSYMGIGLVR